MFKGVESTAVLLVVAVAPSVTSAQDAPFVRHLFGRISAQRTQNGIELRTYLKMLEEAVQPAALPSPPAGHQVHLRP
jgi:hypothetical protein